MPSVPKIGMRLIKTAVAVFLCFLVDFFRDGGTPFYSAIAEFSACSLNWAAV